MNSIKNLINKAYFHFKNNNHCVLCKKNIFNHKTNYNNFCEYTGYSINRNRLYLDFKDSDDFIALYRNSFSIFLEEEELKIDFLYDIEFDDYFELKKYCLDIYNKYKENLIFS